MAKKMLKTKLFHQKYIATAKRYIRQNYNKNLSLRQVARNTGVSEYHFARLFMAYTLESPFQYVKRTRLQEALKLLEDAPDIAITEVALSVGYETPSAFNKVFKNILKMSPRDFRKIGKEEKNKFIYDLGITPIQKEKPMNLNMNFEVVNRADLNLAYVEKKRDFQRSRHAHLV